MQEPLDRDRWRRVSEILDGVLDLPAQVGEVAQKLRGATLRLHWLHRRERASRQAQRHKQQRQQPAQAGGAVKAYKTTPLMSIDEGLGAMRKAAGAGYRPPS